MPDTTTIRHSINSLTTGRELDEIQDAINEQRVRLDKHNAQHEFHFNQEVRFTIKGDSFHGRISTIGKTGKLKITLIGHRRYAFYNCGATFLKENLDK